MSTALLTILLFALVFGVYGLMWYWIGWAKGSHYALTRLDATKSLARVRAELETVLSDLEDYMGIANREAARAQGLEEALRVAEATPRPAPRRLTPEAELERAQFQSEYGMDGNCSCHLSPPCGSCIHPGNPRNQNECDECWERDDE